MSRARRQGLGKVVDFYWQPMSAEVFGPQPAMTLVGVAAQHAAIVKHRTRGDL